MDLNSGPSSAQGARSIPPVTSSRLPCGRGWVTGRVTSSRVGRTTGRDWAAKLTGVVPKIEDAAASTAKRGPTPIFINLRPSLVFTGGAPFPVQVDQSRSNYGRN